MSGHRLERVESLIAQTISGLLIRGDIKDPRVGSLVSVTEVEVAKDLSYAKVGISGFMEDTDLDKAAAGLNSAAGYIQAQLGKAMKTRLTPKLQFFADRRLKEAHAMTKKLEDLLNDQKPSGDAPS
jgi:ribosome-binding factor A